MKKLLFFAVLMLVTVSARSNTYDLNGDGIVDHADCELMSISILNGITNGQMDFNNDGIVDIADLNALSAFINDGSVISPHSQRTTNAPSISMPDIDLNNPENIGRVIELPLVLTMPEGDDFTNIQFHVVFPEGVRPAKDDYNTYGFGGDDIPMAGRPPAPVVDFSDNFAQENFWPEYDVRGANMNKIPVTTNPCHFYTMNVICDAAAPAGQFKFYLKYVKYNNAAVEIGSCIAGEGGVPVYTGYYTPIGGNIIPADYTPPTTPSLSLPDIDLNNPDNIGSVIELPLMLTLPEGDDFTDIQFHVVFPEGVRPAKDEYNTYGFGGDDIPMAGRPPAPVVNFSDNFAQEDFYPEYDVIGANMNKVPVTANPCHFYTMNVICDAAAPAGQFKFYLKTTHQNYYGVELGSCEAGPGGVPVYTGYYTPIGGNIIPADYTPPTTPSLSLPDIDLNNPDNIGSVIELPLVLTMPEGDDFTNIQFHVVFPEGVRPAKDEYNTYGFGGDDIPMAGRPPAPVVNFSDNFAQEDFYPEYDVIGANMNKVPVTANPCHFYTMNVICDAAAPAGQFKFYLKYTKQNYDAVELGSCEAGPGGVPVYTSYYIPEGGKIIKSTTATITAPDINIESPNQLGQLIEVPLTLGIEGELTTWKNIQIDLTYPEGVVPCLDEYGTYGYATSDTDVIPNAGRPPAPVVNFSDNFTSATDNNYIIFGSNMTATPCNPGHIYTVNIKVNEDVANGEYPILVYAKVILTDDRSVTIGTSETLQALCNINVNIPNTNHYDLNFDGVVDRVDYSLLVDRIANGAVYNSKFDLDGNGSVDVLDANLLLDEFQDSQGLQTYTVNGVSFTMIPVEGGTFTMGATAEQGNSYDADELPTHQVTVSSYKIAQTEVTQALWQAVMGGNPSGFTGDLQRPVENVSWNDCQNFINQLNQITGLLFRLPTEAEWEYAARGGKNSQGYKYAGSNSIDEVAWYENNSNSSSHPVGAKAPNEIGLYDMSGNVWEWCQDWYGSYSSESQTNPMGPDSGNFRVSRGAGWHSSAEGCRNASRTYNAASTATNRIGFRLAQ